MRKIAVDQLRQIQQTTPTSRDQADDVISGQLRLGGVVGDNDVIREQTFITQGESHELLSL
jgi:hypothetical protein